MRASLTNTGQDSFLFRELHYLTEDKKRGMDSGQDRRPYGNSGLFRLMLVHLAINDKDHVFRDISRKIGYTLKGT